MKKLALGLRLAALSSGALVQAADVVGTTNVVVGGAAPGAGGALGAAEGITAGTALTTAGVVGAATVAAGGSSPTASKH